MKKAKGLLTTVTVGNVILTVLSFITLGIGCLIALLGAEVMGNAGNSLGFASVEADGFLQGMADSFNAAAGGALAAALGLIMVVGGFIYFILHLIPMIIALVANSSCKNLMETDAEACRSRIKKAAIASTVFNAITMIFSFILTIGEMAFLLVWMIVYVVLVFTLISSIRLIISATKDSFYAVETDNAAFVKPVEPVRASRKGNEFGGAATTVYASEHSAVTAQKMAEKAAAKAAKAEAEAREQAEKARIEAEAARAEAEAARADAEIAKEEALKAKAEAEAVRTEIKLAKEEALNIKNEIESNDK